MATPLDARAPAGFDRVLRCVESVGNYTSLRLTDDFAHQMQVTKAECDAAIAFIDIVLRDEAIANSDIKGLLNRLLGAWGVTSPYGENAKGARRHIEGARNAMAAWNGWIS